jgi:3-phenylpropionate/trans-cinnamate dioxygenase ferredoxin reductase subunit
MSGRETIVVVGGGLAGGKAVQSAREQGFDGRIVLFGNEAHAPYERPALSKEYLRGETDVAHLAVHDDAFYAQHDVELRTGTTVATIDRRNREVVLVGGERCAYTRLLLATGSSPRRLEIATNDLGGLHYLRTIADADRLRRDLEPGARVVVVGAGWIGSEVAASARRLGCEVTVVEPGRAPLHRVLGDEVARIYRDIHEEHGVRFVLGAQVEAMYGGTSIAAVALTTGERLDADVVVIGIGADPRTELASASGLSVGNGVHVDEQLRTSDEHIYAAGDIAAAYHPFYGARVRVEHWANALNQGVVAGRNLAGADDVYDRLPYFFSDQYDIGMEYLGYAPRWDRVVVRGEPDDRKFIAFWISGERVVAAMNVNVWDVGEPLRKLLFSRAPVDVTRLEDAHVPLDDVA